MKYIFQSKLFDCEFIREDGMTILMFNKLDRSLVGIGALYNKDNDHMVASNSYIQLSGTEIYNVTNLPGKDDYTRLPRSFKYMESDESFDIRLDTFEGFAKKFGWNKVRRNHLPGWF